MQFNFVFQLDKSRNFEVPVPDSDEVENTEVLVIASAKREDEVAGIFRLVAAELHRRLEQAGLLPAAVEP